MATISIRRGTTRAFEALGHLRETDYADLPLSPTELLTLAFDRGDEVWEAFVDDEVALIWGFVPGGVFEPTKIWMFTTPFVDSLKFTFLIESRRRIAEALERFGVLSVVASTSKSARWLRWLGFTGDPLTMRL